MNIFTWHLITEALFVYLDVYIPLLCSHHLCVECKRAGLLWQAPAPNSTSSYRLISRAYSQIAQMLGLSTRLREPFKKAGPQITPTVPPNKCRCAEALFRIAFSCLEAGSAPDSLVFKHWDNSSTISNQINQLTSSTKAKMSFYTSIQHKDFSTPSTFDKGWGDRACSCLLFGLWGKIHHKTI